MAEMLRDFCWLYNAALQQRIEAYRRRKLSLSYMTQTMELKALRVAEPDYARWSFTALNQVLRRLDQAYKAFFRRGRGFPRFRASSRYHAATFVTGDGLSIKSDRVGITGVPGAMKVVWHRALPSDAKIRTGVITRQQDKWYIVFSVDAEFTGNAVGTRDIGIDVGLTSLIATSEGEAVAMPSFARKAQKAQRRRGRALSRCQRQSKRRLKARARLAAGSACIARQRRDHLHKLSRSLVARYGRIAFEDLNMTGLTKGMFARSVHDAAWSTLVDLTTYKAASAGAEVVLVDPRGTSQTCPECGIIRAKTLKERLHRCECGCTLDRDVAAAKIVHLRAFGHRPGHGLQALTGQVAA